MRKIHLKITQKEKNIIKLKYQMLLTKIMKTLKEKGYENKNNDSYIKKIENSN